MSLKRPKIILASASAARRAMLENAGLAFGSCPAHIDEASYFDGGMPVDILALTLAREKALHVSMLYQDALVIGSDQTLDFEKNMVSKSKSVAEAKERLREMRGKTHALYSGVAVARHGEILWTYSDHASLTMHNFEDAFLDAYVRKNEDALLHCVGGYKIEGMGAWLFSKIEGDHFTIMGMPLLPLLDYLREKQGFIL